MEISIKELIKKYREISEEKLTPYSSDEQNGYHDGKVDLAEDIVYDLEKLKKALLKKD